MTVILLVLNFAAYLTSSLSFITLRETKSCRREKKAKSGHFLCGREAGGMLELEGNFETMESNTFILHIEEDLRKVTSLALGHIAVSGRSGT